MDSKLGFLISVASQLEIFLKMYQSDLPLLPFTHEDLHETMRSLMSRVIKSKVLKEATSAFKLVNVDLKDENNLISTIKIDIGFAAACGL